MKYFVHPNAICESTSVGEGSRVWAFAHVLPGARIGADCNLCDHVFVENDVVLGDRVTIKSGVQLWDGLRIGDDVFVGPNATFSNDRYPRSRQWQSKPIETTIEERASIGANSTVLPGVRVGRGAMVGAGAVVTKDVPANAIVVGNPARIVGYASASGAPEHSLREDVVAPSPDAPLPAVGVGGVELRRLKAIEDLRGSLVAAELGDELPFLPKRVFMVVDVPTQFVRGEHAHLACEQFLVAARGSLSVVVDDGRSRRQLRLADPAVGLYVPPLTWVVHYGYSPDALLMVLASQPYDADDYVREYGRFLEISKAAASAGGEPPPSNAGSGSPAR